MELAREIPLTDGDGRSRLEMPVTSSGEGDLCGPLPVKPSAYQRIEILQLGADLFEAVGFNKQAWPETLATGDADDLRDQFPGAEVFTCAAQGGDECTILPGEDRCRICES
jgi:hypothetical protein